MMRTISLIFVMAAFLISKDCIGQCKEQKDPNRFLYKAMYSNDRFDVAKPTSVDYATKVKIFFDAFVFTGAYSYALQGNEPYFYLNLAGPASYPYEVTESDSAHFYFSDGTIVKLPPSCNQHGIIKCTAAFYNMDNGFLNAMATLTLDSISMKFTPRPTGKMAERTKLERSFTFKNFSKKRTAQFKEIATCFQSVIR